MLERIKNLYRISGLELPKKEINNSELKSFLRGTHEATIIDMSEPADQFPTAEPENV